MLMGVYGTLREGFGNYNYFLKGKKCQGTIEVEGFEMYSLGGYPCIVHTGKKKNTIVMEVYKLDDKKDKQIIESINRMEFGAGYSTKEIKTKLGKVMCYVFDSKPSYGKCVDNGDWKKFCKL